MALGEMVQWGSQAGQTTRYGDVTVTPQSQFLAIHWPNGGFVWNRPVAVLVEREGESERVPIPDVTLMAQLGLLGLSILILLGSLVFSTRNRRK